MGRSEAGPSAPVEVIGFPEVPSAGDTFIVVEDEKRARQIALARQQKQRLVDMARARKLTLDELYAKIKEGEIKDLNERSLGGTFTFPPVLLDVFQELFYLIPILNCCIEPELDAWNKFHPESFR